MMAGVSFQSPVPSFQWSSLRKSLGTGNWQLDTSSELIQHPSILPFNRLQQIDLQSRRQHVPRVGLDLEMSRKAGLARESEHLTHVVLRRGEAIVFAREQGDVKMNAPL